MKLFYAAMALISAALIASSVMIINSPAGASERTFNSPQRCQRLLAKQFGGSANVFTTTNPDADGTPLTLTSATGKSGNDGIVTVSMGGGFTAPVTLTVFQWQLDNVTAANAGWRRIGAAAADYSCAFDSHYTSRQFSISEGTPYLILSSAAVTGNVYVGDGGAHPSNTGSTATGY